MKRVGEIVETLLREFKTAPPAPDSPVESTREIAARFNISPVTADRALKELVKKDICYRIKHKGTFFRGFPDDKADCPLIGYATPMDHKLESSKNLHRTMLASLRRKYRVRIIWYDELLSSEIAREELSGLDALILTYQVIDHNVMNNLKDFSGPVILLKCEFLFTAPFHQVMPDFSESFSEAARYIAEFAMKPVMIIFCNHPNERFRFNRMKQYMIDAGIQPEHIEVVEVEYADYERSAWHKAEKIFPHIDERFIFCTSDIISSIIIKYAGERGKIAGLDYELLSYDNLDPEDDFLSVIDSNYMKLPEITLILLNDVLNSKEKYRRTVYIPTRLLIRKTALAKMKNNTGTGARLEIARDAPPQFEQLSQKMGQ